MMNFNIFTLKGCSSCEAFKLHFDEIGIKYNEIVCSEDINSKFCDNIEAIAKCERYPMAMINNEYIICIGDDVLQLGKVQEFKNYKIIYCHSINNIAEVAKKILYLK